MVALYYSSQLSVVGSVLHGIAIVCTVFRLVYRGWMRHLWWEDAWAALALIADVTCLACIWVDTLLSSWIITVAFTTVLWAARMSVIFSIIPIANHSESKIHKRVISLVVVCFGCMWTALLVLKINICKFDSCRMGKSVGISHLVTDIIADITLVVVPLYLLGTIGHPRSSMILVQFVFGASLLVLAFTIPHSVLLLHDIFNTNALMFAHIKVAFSLIICNLLVIVTFLYRVYLKDTSDINQPLASNGVFTSIILIPMGGSTNAMTSLSLQDGITSRQVKSADWRDEE
ncbi:hypothetical protein BDR04DRAFT_1056138 [Suillus decipiens]|nr:hypothetical protein BDR04DRAFT_1056138 [Suillus decipiens]